MTVFKIDCLGILLPVPVMSLGELILLVLNFTIQHFNDGEDRGKLVALHNYGYAPDDTAVVVSQRRAFPKAGLLSHDKNFCSLFCVDPKMKAIIRSLG